MFRNDSTSRLIHDSVSEGKEIPYVNSGHHNWNECVPTDKPFLRRIMKAYEMAKSHTKKQGTTQT